MLRFASALERVTPLKSLRHETKRRKASGTQLPNRTGREPDGTSIMQLLPANLRHAARFAASNDTRYAVSGLLLESKPDGSYRLDATDTRKAIIVTGTSNLVELNGRVYFDTTVNTAKSFYIMPAFLDPSSA